MMFYDNSEKDVLILAEHKNESIDSITFQLATKGQELADILNCELNAILIGHQLDSLAKQLQGKGFNKIFVADHPLLERYNPEIYSSVISDFFKNRMPALFLMGYTYPGMELGPAIATRLGVRIISNCVDAESSNGHIVLTLPMFGGTVHTKWKSEKLPLVISIQKDVIPIKEPSQTFTTLLPIDVNIDPVTILTKVGDLIYQPSSGIDITKADILVAAGQGLGKLSGLDLVKELADTLHGTVACSRPLAQWGWLPPDCYVGVSGKTVHPKIYIACGISGASQHIAGMKDSTNIIAINNDIKAPIFQVAHYGIVGDIYEIIPALIKTLKESRKFS